MTEWIKGWIRKNWVSSQKTAVMNRDLWERLLRASQSHEVEWLWIKGHNGHAENERCDELARAEIKECKRRMKGEET
jgi:ribonuclease HI